MHEKMIERRKNFEEKRVFLKRKFEQKKERNRRHLKDSKLKLKIKLGFKVRVGDQSRGEDVYQSTTETIDVGMLSKEAYKDEGLRSWAAVCWRQQEADDKALHRAYSGLVFCRLVFCRGGDLIRTARFLAVSCVEANSL